MSVEVPYLPIGWRLLEASFFSSDDKRLVAKGVSVRDGAIQFTLILALANSAAKEMVNPSIAPFEAATEA